MSTAQDQTRSPATRRHNSVSGGSTSVAAERRQRGFLRAAPPVVRPNIMVKGTNAICRDSRSHHALKSIGADCVAFLRGPCRADPSPPHTPLLCQPVSKLHIRLGDSYNSPVVLLVTHSQCRFSQPRRLWRSFTWQETSCVLKERVKKKKVSQT